jgi:hypothetical protein
VDVEEAPRQVEAGAAELGVEPLRHAQVAQLVEVGGRRGLAREPPGRPRQREAGDEDEARGDALHGVTV